MPGISHSPRLRLLAVAAILLLALSLGSWKLFRVETSITEFMPKGQSQELFELSAALSDSSLTKQMIVTVGPPGLGPEVLAQASAALSSRLSQIDGFTQIRRGPEPGVDEAFFELYFPRRFLLLSDDPRAAWAALDTKPGRDQIAKDLVAALSSPDDLLVRPLAPRDPLLAFPSLLGKLEAAGAGGLSVKHQQFFSKDGYAVLLLTLKDSPFQSDKQAVVLAEFEAAVRSVQANNGFNLEVSSTGLNRFALASEASMRADMSRISIWSTVGLLLVYWLLIRRPTRLAFTFLPLIFGTLAALLTTLVVFGEVHAITLAFGSSLIGVAIDFPVHLITHHDLSPPGKDPRQSLREVTPSLLLAGGTTALGLLGMGFSGFPGVRQMSVFAVTGIASGLLAVLAFGRLLGPSLPPHRAMDRAGRAMAMLLQRVAARPHALIAIALVALVLGGFGLTGVHWETDLQALNLPQVDLLDEDRRVRLRAQGALDNRFVVAIGGTVEEALERSEAALGPLEKLAQQGAFSRQTSVHALLWSEKLQHENLKEVRLRPDFPERLRSHLEAEGLVSEAFQPFESDWRALGQSPPAPLSYAEMQKSKLGEWLRPFIVEIPGKAAVITHLDGVKSSAAIQAGLRTLPGVHYFDQKQMLDALYVDVRKRTIELLAFGLLAVGALILVRYRSIKLTFAALIPPVVAGCATLGLLALAGVSLNLLHALALLLVLSMGEDYGVFLVDAARSEAHEAAPAAMLSVGLASLSTILSFGLLSFSAVPALAALGQTVALGDVLSVLCAPIAAFVAKPRRLSS